VGGISGGEGVDGPGGGGRSSFEVSVPQQRGDEQNERGHLSLAKSLLGVAFLMSLGSETAFHERASASRTDFHT